jgi:hypothetical protein
MRHNYRDYFREIIAIYFENQQYICTCYLAKFGSLFLNVKADSTYVTILLYKINLILSLNGFRSISTVANKLRIEVSVLLGCDAVSLGDRSFKASSRSHPRGLK